MSGVVVVGAGLAGLFTALKLAPLPVTVVSGARFGEGASSLWAQGGIAAALAEGDTPEAHAADTIRAGAGIVDEKIALLMAREARERIEDLLSYGVPFDKDLEGHLALGREAAHGRNRILHVKGDMAGRAIMHALIAAVRRTPSITVLEGFAARDLVLRDGSVRGVELAPADVAPSARGFILPASAVVLATGGAGQIYAITTNPREARGEGIAIAARAGAVIADAEFVQFHPTAINIGRDPAPLATEALRGEGALLINARGERFMRAVHDDAELGPRDVVARAVYRRGRERARRLPRLPSAWDAGSSSISRRWWPPAARPASIPRASRSRWRRRPITTWAASSPTRRGAARSTGFGLAARSPRPAPMAPTGLPPTPCSRRSCSAPASPAISPRARVRPRLKAAARLEQLALVAAQNSGSERAEQKLRLAMTEGAGVIRDASVAAKRACHNRHAREGQRGRPASRQHAHHRKTDRGSGASSARKAAARISAAIIREPDERLAKRSFLTLEQAEAIAREAREPAAPARRLRAAVGRAALHA